MRTDIHLKLQCSQCGAELEMDIKKSSVSGRSAFNGEMKMAVKPCAGCYSKAREPLWMMKRALQLIEEKKDTQTI